MSDVLERYRASIKAAEGSVEYWREGCALLEEEITRLRAELADRDARLRSAVECVLNLGLTPDGHIIMLPDDADEFFAAAGFERCKRCGGRGVIVDDYDDYINLEGASEDCDCINGWRPKEARDER